MERRRTPSFIYIDTFVLMISFYLRVILSLSPAQMPLNLIIVVGKPRVRRSSSDPAPAARSSRGQRCWQ